MIGFSNAKRALLVALRAGNFQHEVREVRSEKNLLAVGDVSLEEVISIVNRTRGTDYSAAPHHWDHEITVHLVRPVVERTRWYVRAYFLDEPSGSAVFISVHR